MKVIRMTEGELDKLPDDLMAIVERHLIRASIFWFLIGSAFGAVLVDIFRGR